MIFITSNLFEILADTKIMHLARAIYNLMKSYHVVDIQCTIHIETTIIIKHRMCEFCQIYLAEIFLSLVYLEIRNLFSIKKLYTSTQKKSISSKISHYSELDPFFIVNKIQATTTTAVVVPSIDSQRHNTSSKAMWLNCVRQTAKIATKLQSMQLQMPKLLLWPAMMLKWKSKAAA